VRMQQRLLKEILQEWVSLLYHVLLGLLIMGLYDIGVSISIIPYALYLEIKCLIFIPLKWKRKV
jgi:hypothetical protein